MRTIITLTMLKEMNQPFAYKLAEAMLRHKPYYNCEIAGKSYRVVVK